MKDEQQNPNTTERQSVHPIVVKRSRVLLCIAGGLFILLLLRILILQTVQYDRYQKKVIEQMTTEVDVHAARGSIYDAEGVIIATNITTYRVFISPSSIAAAQVELNEAGESLRLDELIADGLSAALDVSYDFVMEQTTHTKKLDRTIQNEVDEEGADLIRAFIDQYGLQRMVYLQTTSTRYYPYSTLASHVLGFTGSDGTGLYGLEYTYNDLLSGTNGRYITARDASGNEMPYGYKEYIEPEDGYNIHTTLDVFVQSALEEQLKNAYTEADGQNRAAGIVMNVNTGEILGMATYPSFDLNDPWALDSQSLSRLETSSLQSGSEAYSKYKQELLMRMWSNKAITDAYIPGSTFKVITASMALEEAVVDVNTPFSCAGSLKVAGHKIHCHKVQGHGSLNFTQGIQQSCNPVLMTVGMRLGTSAFYSYLRAFGYLEKTGIDLPGEGGSLFASEDAFTELDLAIYSFGQNFNVTLIQQVTAVAAVANGGYLVKPHLISSVTDADGKVIQAYDTTVRRQVVSSAVCKTVSDILEKGVSGDGGAKNAYVAGYRVAAKTGTSEKKDVGSIGKYVCSTVAYAPADDPQYAVIIIVDEPTKGTLYGSTVAAPYVGNVMEAILPYLGVEAVYTEKELEKLTVTVPDCRYGNVSYVKSFCEKQYHLTVEVVGDPDGVVYKQYPEPGTVVEKAYGRVILYTDRKAEPETVIVPNVTGKSAVAANQMLVNAGLNIRIEGTKNYETNDAYGTGAVVITQSLVPGTTVPRGTVVEVTFRHLNADDDPDAMQ